MRSKKATSNGERLPSRAGWSAQAAGVCVVLGLAAVVAAQPCVVPDNGGGTITLPPAGCDYLSPDEVHEILDGLPPVPPTTIELAAIHKDFICGQGTDPPAICSVALPANLCEDVGGSLGGNVDCFYSTLALDVTGTGALAGYNRNLTVPAECEVHTGPRNPGDPVQTFPNDMFRLQGQLSGDPDFCTFVITAGTDYGLPSPGQTTLTDLGGGQWAVDSFFDITYRIDFVGCPGSILDGMSGSTTGTIRMTTNPPQDCAPTADGTACQVVQCAVTPQECVPRCVNFDPATGAITVVDCQCREPGECYVDLGSGVRGQRGTPCVVPDDAGGTVTLPPAGCEYLSPDEVHEILDGLPPTTTIELAAIHKEFWCKQGGAGFPDCPPPGTCEDDGGALGGKRDCFISTLELQVSGTGALAGFNRLLSVPADCQVYTAARTPGDPVQDFDTEMYRLQGELFGDPDFCTFRVTAGAGFGLPSPGHTTLVGLPGGSFAVDSFFDITYQIDYVGCPGSVLDGMSGSTIGTIRMETGTQFPSCAGTCPAGTTCVQTLTDVGDGTVDVCCDCVPDEVCGPDPTGAGCLPVTCPDPNQQCVPTCVLFDPATGTTTVLNCECRDPNECQVDMSGAGAAKGLRGDPCVVPDDAGGTITLPPAGCEYLSPDEVHEILDGLPPTPPTTIELAAIHKGFMCRDPGTSFPDCPPAPTCEDDGGLLGGKRDCFTSDLDLQVQGTGALATFSRNLIVPAECQVYTAPRTPGDAVQDFDTEMYRLQGELFGDPDFCTFRVTAGGGFGLPSPGHTTLTQLPSGDFAVDSFFDITYQIEYVGCVGSVLEGMSGTTVGTIRMETGARAPGCVGACPVGTDCVETVVTNADGTVEVCCDCLPGPCVAVAVRSYKNHGGGTGRLAVDMGVSGGTEPRLGGITEIEIDLAAGGGASFGGGVTVACTTPWVGTTSGAVAGDTVTVTFTGALPDEAYCVVTLDCGASVCVRGLEGDTDGNGVTATTDAGIIKPLFGSPATSANARFDVDTNGTIATTDFGVVKPRFGHSAPDCP